MKGAVGGRKGKSKGGGSRPLAPHVAAPLPETPPSLLAASVVPSELATLQLSLMRSMEAIARWDANIGAMCMRRAQLHNQMLSQQLYLYESLATATWQSSVFERGVIPDLPTTGG